jgi:aerobic carbon-monoxide dehydrogenase large subunit
MDMQPHFSGEALSPSTTLCPPRPTRLGIKGCGEAGCAGALVSVMNVDALSPYGIRHIDMLAPQEQVCQAVRRAQSAPVS